MRLLGDVVSLRTVTGDAVTVGDITVTPRAQALVVRLPFAAFVWNRPTSVQVERGGQVQNVRIVRVSQLVSIAAILLSVLVTLVSVSRRSPGKESKDHGDGKRQ